MARTRAGECLNPPSSSFLLPPRLKWCWSLVRNLRERTKAYDEDEGELEDDAVGFGRPAGRSHRSA